MPISDYLRDIRAKVGPVLLVVPSAACLIRDSAGRLLLVRHSEGGVWVIPGGGVDPLELPADAAAREAWEETHLRVEPVRVWGVYGGPATQVRYANGDEVSYVMTVFECRILGGELAPDGEETLEAGFFTTEEIAAMKVPDWVRLVLADGLREPGRAVFQRGGWAP